MAISARILWLFLILFKKKAAYFLTPLAKWPIPAPRTWADNLYSGVFYQDVESMKKTCNQISNLYWFDLKADYFSRIILIVWLYVSLFILVVREKLLYNDLNTNITSNSLLDLNWLKSEKIKYISLSSFRSFCQPLDIPCILTINNLSKGQGKSSLLV